MKKNYLKRALKAILRKINTPLLHEIKKEFLRLHESQHHSLEEMEARIISKFQISPSQEPIPEKFKSPIAKKNYTLNAAEVDRLLTLAKSKEVIVVGANQVGLELQNALEAQGTRVEYFVDYVSEPGLFGGHPLRSLYDLLLDDLKNKLVAIAMWHTGGVWAAHMYTLMEMGLKPGEDIIAPLLPPVLGHLDACLGHNYASGEKPGFRIWGDHTNESAKVVVVLGGSTSDSFLVKYSDFYTSWPELLYRRLAAFDKNIVVYSGAVFSFCTTQELHKFLRDVLPIKPHIVISYSSYNDIWHHIDEESLKSCPPIRGNLHTPLMGRPYLHNSTRMFFEAAAHVIDPSNLPADIQGNQVCYGLPNTLTPAEVWLNNMTIMHSVAQAFSCEFIGILQPSLYTTSKARNLTNFTDLLTKQPRRTAYFKKCIGKIKERLPQHPYLLDYTDLFSNNDDALFCDLCHVRPLGNHMIAAKVHSDMVRLNLLKSCVSA